MDSPVLERLGRILVVGGRKRIESRVFIDCLKGHHEVCVYMNNVVLSRKYWQVVTSQRLLYDQ